MLESCGQATLHSQLVLVEERCVFLQKIYKYHSVAEDEVGLSWKLLKGQGS